MDGEAARMLIGHHYTRPARFVSSFRGALHYVLKPRPLAVRPDELRAIRRACGLCPWIGCDALCPRLARDALFLGRRIARRGVLAGARPRERYRHRNGSADLLAPNGGHLT